MTDAKTFRSDCIQSFYMTGIIACTFFYFLIFAQFAFLHRMESIDSSKQYLEASMGAMALGGFVGCLLVARRFKASRCRMWLVGGFVSCGLVAVFVGLLNTPLAFPFLGAGVGIALGCLTVAVAASLRNYLASHRIGFWTGLGVGVAYFFSNLPIIFSLDSRDQCLVAVLVCSVGAVLGMQLRSGNNKKRHGYVPTEALKHSSPLYGASAFFAIILFLILVWFDSAAFYVIQETEQLKSESWGSDGLLWQNGIVHFLVAIGAGWFLDRGYFIRLLALAMIGLFLGMVGLQDSIGAAISWVWPSVYVASVSIYSTALTAFVALRYDGENTSSAACINAALLYAVAGWFGSAMGIGMARDLNRIPWQFVVISFALFGLISALLVRRNQKRLIIEVV